MTPSHDRTRFAGIDHTASWLINQASTHSHRIVHERFAAAGARGYHYRLLAALRESGPGSQAELGRRTGIDRSDVVAALNELAAGGLIERAPDPSDRRRNIVTLTPAGTRHERDLRGVLTEIQDELLAPLTADERDRLTGLLTKIVDHHAAGRPAPSTPRPPGPRHH